MLVRGVVDMKFFALICVVGLALLTAGCAVGGKNNVQTPAQQPASGSTAASCNLEIVYNCADAVMGEDYVCTPAVRQVAPYDCNNPPAAALGGQATMQAKLR
jgi:hypothetical protein